MANERDIYGILGDTNGGDYDSNTDTLSFLGNTDTNSKNSLVPPAPKDGEYLYCQWCKNKMLPQELSRDRAIRDKEVKWHYHETCRLGVMRNLDMQTPGLMAERRMFEKRQKAYEESLKPKEVKRAKTFLEMSTRGNRR